MRIARSADARQLLAGEPVDDPPAAERGAHLDEAVGVLDRAADDRRIARRADGRCIAASTASATSGATIATSLPSLATLSGSRPRNSQAAATSARTGIAVLLDA